MDHRYKVNEGIARMAGACEQAADAVLRRGDVESELKTLRKPTEQ